MAARRYEICLRVLKYFHHEKRNLASPSGYVMFYLLYKHQWNTKPFHWNSFFPAKGAIYYVAIATVIFSHLKITCYFHVWRYHVFARKLTLFFIGVYIINQIIFGKGTALIRVAALYRSFTVFLVCIVNSLKLCRWSNPLYSYSKCWNIHRS